MLARGAEVEISSGEEVLARPNAGRDVAAGTVRSAEQARLTAVDSEVLSHDDLGDHSEV